MFNHAFVTKQAWNMTQPNSLTMKIRKGKYFHDSDFLQTQVKGGASFKWKNVMSGRQLLVQGLRWMVGKGFRNRLDINPI